MCTMEQRKQRWTEIKRFKNMGILESQGWKNISGNLPPNSGGDSEGPYQSRNINFVVNNAEHKLHYISCMGVLFINWDGEVSMHYCSLDGGDDILKIDNKDLLGDIYWKCAEYPKLNYLLDE